MKKILIVALTFIFFAIPTLAYADENEILQEYLYYDNQRYTSVYANENEILQEYLYYDNQRYTAYIKENEYITENELTVTFIDELGVHHTLEFVEYDENTGFVEIFINPRLRQNGQHASTFDVTNSLISSNLNWTFTNAPRVTVETSNTSWAGAASAGNLTFFLERRGTFNIWHEADRAAISAIHGGSATLSYTSGGTFRVVIFNGTGFRATGNITVTWSS